MRINDIEEALRAKLDLLEKARLELAEVYRERDRVLSEIKDQRDGKKEVSSQKTVLIQIRDMLIAQTSILKDQTKQNRSDFASIFAKQVSYLDSIKSEIDEYELRYKEAELKKVNIEEFDEKLLKIKNDIVSAKSELSSIQKESEKTQTALDKRTMEIEKKEKEIEESKKEIREAQVSLREREKSIELSEKRLAKYKEELLSKK